MVFPEGTRSRSNGTLLPFKKGCFNLAVSGQVPIVPIVVSNQKSVYDSKNWLFPGGDIKVKSKSSDHGVRRRCFLVKKTSIPLISLS